MSMPSGIMQEYRRGFEAKFTIQSGESESKPVDMSSGCFGTIIVPAGSPLVGQPLQVQAVSRNDNFEPTDLLSAPKVLDAGANAMTLDEIREFGGASLIRFTVPAPVASDAQAVLLMKA